VEQKNGDIVRKIVGYFRFDTDADQAASAEVYRYLRPLSNYWHPAIKVMGKRRLENRRYPEEGSKAELRRCAAQYNPVKLKGLTRRLPSSCA
jgi:hypothetical protein